MSAICLTTLTQTAVHKSQSHTAPTVPALFWVAMGKEKEVMRGVLYYTVAYGTST